MISRSTLPAFDSGPRPPRFPDYQPWPGRAWVSGCTGPLALGLTAGVFLLDRGGRRLQLAAAWPAERSLDDLAARRACRALWESSPGWTAIPKQAGAEEQYRCAQLHVPLADDRGRVAGRPGLFPAVGEWVSPAYIQVARRLYRRRDIDRLTALGGRDTGWQGGQDHRQGAGRDRRSGRQIAGQGLDGVIEVMSRVSSRDDHDPMIYDPGSWSSASRSAPTRLPRRPTRTGSTSNEKLRTFSRAWLMSNSEASRLAQGPVG